jgi:hypothetical protein
MCGTPKEMIDLDEKKDHLNHKGEISPFGYSSLTAGDDSGVREESLQCLQMPNLSSISFTDSRKILTIWTALDEFPEEN